jgi:hypothetical protein
MTGHRTEHDVDDKLAGWLARVNGKVTTEVVVGWFWCGPKPVPDPDKAWYEWRYGAENKK